MFPAGVAHPVERHLAKVEVASSSLVTRSIKRKTTRLCGLSFCAIGKAEFQFGEVLHRTQCLPLGGEGAPEGRMRGPHFLYKKYFK